MKRIIIVAMLTSALAASASALAFTPAGNSRRSSTASTSVDTEIESLSQQLDLTKAQKSKVKNILQDQANHFDALQKNTSMSADDKKAKGKEIRANTLVQVRAILTPDQQQKFDDLHLKGIKKKQRTDSAGQ